MLVLYIFILMFTNSINHLQKNIHSTFINRITIITLLISILFTYNTLYFQSIGKGISIYSGLYQITVQSHIVELLLLIVGISILLGWPFLLLNKYRFVPKAVGHDIIKENGSSDKTTQSGTKIYEVLSISKSDQYSLIAIFSILGGSLLMSSLDLLSMYLSIELQSFALYILATLNKERLSATSAGLKYFLLGSLSSCFILLGSAIIYSYTGLTQFEAINSLMSTPYFGTVSILRPELDLVKPGLIEMWDINKAFTIGLIIIFIGFLFKISAAPFYQWAPDVYDGTPTIVTVWLTIVVKLTILVFLQELVEFTLPDTFTIISDIKSCLSPGPVTWITGHNNAIDTNITGTNVLGGIQIKNLLLISSLLSLLIGTIAGLSQIKVKRLLAFSSISHVGFLLLALGIYTQKSVDSFIFYLIQYSVTSLNIFLILLAFGYLLFNYKYLTLIKRETDLIAQSLPSQDSGVAGAEQKDYKPFLNMDITLAPRNKENYTFVSREAEDNTDINYLVELKGQLLKNPVLSISLAICLFSMAGIPPLIGFFSKQFVLFSSIENGNNFLSIIAILVSVISASYYLRLIKITFFDSLEKNESSLPFTNEACLALVSQAEERVTSSARREITANSVNSTALGKIINLKEEQEEVIIYLSSIHSYIIAILTLLILFFFLDPSILLNGTQLISLTIFNI